MNVLVDWIGHSDLYYSMHALFERHLGWTLYRPLPDPQWDAHGITTIATLPAYAKILNPLDNNNQCIDMDFYQYQQKAISFQQFLDLDIDFIVSTSWMNEEPLFNLCNTYKPKAKLLRQIANIGEVPKVAKNILLSTTTPMSSKINWIKYTPEHLDIFHPDLSVQPDKKIKSFFNNAQVYPEALSTWETFKGRLSSFIFKMHGHDSRDGSIPQIDLANCMRESMFVWHTKPLGCCGYTARQALACGKPLIVDKRYSRRYNTLAVNYLVDGVNCIDLAARTDEQSIQMILDWSQPEQYKIQCQKVIDSLKVYMDFSQEATNIKQWLEEII